MKLQIEKASQMINIVTLHFKSAEDASEFYDLIDSDEPITIQRVADKVSVQSEGKP